MLHPNSRKYFFATLGIPYAPELEFGCPSGWMHINGIYIRYRTKNNPDDFFGKLFFALIFWKMLDFRLELLKNPRNVNNLSRKFNIFQKIYENNIFPKKKHPNYFFVL